VERKAGEGWAGSQQTKTAAREGLPMREVANEFKFELAKVKLHQMTNEQ
jgi:hypothetical protein